MATIFLGIGSNLGDREGNLQRALAGLDPAIRLEQISPLYETEPAYVLEQPRFLNLVCQAQTQLDPVATLRYVKQVEVAVGRTETVRYGPRVIDLDLLFYDDLCWQDPELTLPHPRLAERAFVLVPLADIAPGWIHPQLDSSIQTLLADLGDTRPLIWRYAESLSS